MITAELLRKFIDTHDPREYLRTPWADGEFVYATNGHYGVRIMGKVDDITAAVKSEKHPDMDALFAKHGLQIGAVFSPSDLMEVPDLPEFVACDLCSGVGHGTDVKCGDCGGNGYFVHGKHEYDCIECEGDGRGFHVGHGDQSCPDCLGTGESLHPIREVAVGISKFQAAYIRVISQLPCVRLSPGPEAISPLRFFFDGGCGLLMPLKPQ